VWILYFLECPYHTQHVKFNDVFNWTATYRRDSDIVAPYERWAYYDERVKQNRRLDRNYAANKTKKVSCNRNYTNIHSEVEAGYSNNADDHVTVLTAATCRRM
jgi:hypothetical protein